MRAFNVILSILLMLVSVGYSQTIVDQEFFKDGSVLREKVQVDGTDSVLLSEYYPSGELFFKYFLVNGVQQGHVTSYFENGQMMKESWVTDGNRNGWQFEYYKTGELRSKEKYENEIRVDSLFRFYQDGTLHSINVFLGPNRETYIAYDHGVKVFSRTSNNGWREGPEIIYDRERYAQQYGEEGLIPTIDQGKIIYTTFCSACHNSKENSPAKDLSCTLNLENRRDKFSFVNNPRYHSPQHISREDFQNIMEYVNQKCP